MWNHAVFDSKCEELLRYLKQEREEMKSLEDADNL